MMFMKTHHDDSSEIVNNEQIGSRRKSKGNLHVHCRLSVYSQNIQAKQNEK